MSSVESLTDDGRRELMVSVVMPVFNGAEFLRDAVISIQNQTFQDWELIILDDGSTDQSYEIAKSICLNDERLKVLHQTPNRGLAYTMNQLVRLARGRYIAVQEQDDFSLPMRFEKEVKVLESQPEIGLVSGIAEWIDDAGNKIALFPGMLTRGEQFPQDRFQMVQYLYVEQSKIVNAACMFRRSIIEEIPGPFDELARISIDWQFFLHLAHKHLVWGIPEILVKMRRGSSHQHLTRNRELLYREARRCIEKIYREYSPQVDSPINGSLYRKSMAFELNLEGRGYGGVKGVSKIIIALLYDPTCLHAWRTLAEYIQRGFAKVRRWTYK